MNFSGFSPDSFEQLTQALALKVLGPGVTIFGNGPDGGREATFNGKVSFPSSPANCWNGYGVIQAKFKEKTETTPKDQSWALSQLEKELKAWQKSKKRTPKPDYFIYCVNVELSAATNGGLDKIEDLLKQYEPLLGLKGYDVWDANKLLRLVDDYEAIRHRFTHFFTPGDLLAAFAKQLTNAPDAEAILTAYLSQQVIIDEDARLNQAGVKTDDRIKLADVFVDLPIPTASGESNALQQLLQAASAKLDPQTLHQHKSAAGHDTDNLFGRFVFLGGPGSGKSTIGQFVAQIHRAALLARRPDYLFEDKVIKAINAIKTRCDQDQFSWPATPRYPFRIDLNNFAKALASDSADKGVSTLSEYLRKKLSQDQSLSHEDLKNWLKTYPWLLILDGLDEVPSSSNRSEVIAAIDKFLGEARFAEADLMVIATSRPDGYANEFGNDDVAHHQLAAFSESQAMACAQRYVNAKYGSKDHHEAIDAMDTLGEAINNPLVAKLMHSPLQVTFMVTLVTAGHRPSKSRWQLFNDYYKIIYERELQKAVPPFSKVLSERKQDIDTLHHDVGFILQCKAERSGETQADMPSAEFKAMVLNSLEENGLQDNDLSQQTELILGAASQRLVFLTSKTKDRLSFEVRSLQEYMAAACITDADLADIIIRLKAIAHSAYWRNTFLFAVGRFFVDAHLRKHRDKIRLLCVDLNRETPEQQTSKLGSRLALEILESGTIGNTPVFIRSLTDTALDLLAFPPERKDNLTKKLANIYSEEMEFEYQEQIKNWIGQSKSDLTLSAWMLLFYLEEREISWAEDMVQANWPTDGDHAWLVLKTWIFDIRYRNYNIRLNKREITRLEDTILLVSVEGSLYHHNFENIRHDHLTSSWLLPLITRQEPSPIELLNGTTKTGMEFELLNIPSADKKEVFKSFFNLSLEENVHPSWHILQKITEFELELKTDYLYKTLQLIATDCDESEWAFWATCTSWPVALCIQTASSKSELLALAQQAKTKQLGNIEDWKAKQKSWIARGILIDEVFTPVFKNGIVISSIINLMRLCKMRDHELRGHGWRVYKKHTPQPPAKNSHALLQQVIKNQNKPMGRLPNSIGHYASINRVLHLLDPAQLLDYVLPNIIQPHSAEFIIDQEQPLNNINHWLNLFEVIGNKQHLIFAPHLMYNYPTNLLLKTYLNNTTRIGLLRLAGFWCAAGATPTIDLSALQKIEPCETAQERLAVMLLTLSKKDLTAVEAQEIAKQIPTVTTDESEPNAKEALLNIINVYSSKIPALEIILRNLITTLDDEWKMRAQAIEIHNAMIQAAKSDFDRKTLAKLALPAG